MLVIEQSLEHGGGRMNLMGSSDWLIASSRRGVTDSVTEGSLEHGEECMMVSSGWLKSSNDASDTGNVVRSLWSNERI